MTPTDRPTTESPKLALVPARRVAERDYFPCAFCYVQFATRDERWSHEATRCERADEKPVPPPTEFVVEVDPRLLAVTVEQMLRKAGLKLVNRGENRPYLLTSRGDPMIANYSIGNERTNNLVTAEAVRIRRLRDL